MLDIYVDADGCPVKDEVYKVAGRYKLGVYLVSNRRLQVPAGGGVKAVVVGDGFDEADDWIAEHAGPGDIVVTADLPLADRCIKTGARVLGPKGNIHDEDSIGSALASRDLMAELRQSGEFTGGPAPMMAKDRSLFLSRLDQVIQDLKRKR